MYITKFHECISNHYLTLVRNTSFANARRPSCCTACINAYSRPVGIDKLNQKPFVGKQSLPANNMSPITGRFTIICNSIFTDMIYEGLDWASSISLFCTFWICSFWPIFLYFINPNQILIYHLKNCFVH